MLPLKFKLKYYLNFDIFKYNTTYIKLLNLYRLY